MKLKNNITKKRILALFITNIIPLSAIIFGIDLLTDNFIVKSSYIISYFILPVLAISLSCFILFSDKRRSFKFIVLAMVLLVFTIIFCATVLIEKHEQIRKFENEEVGLHYTETIQTAMPSLSAISQPINIEYYNYFSSQLGIFTCEADFLICKYDEKEYLEQKELLSKKYIFQSDSITTYDYETTVELDGYCFRLLSIDEYEMNYPKSIVFIGTSDIENEIVYMYFCDDDLDYIESLSDFINEDCGWKHIH